MGAEYEAFDWLDVRLGYALDISPVPDQTANYLVPANDRHLYTFGLGIHRKPWVLDLSYGYLHVENRTVRARFKDGILDSRFEGGHAHLIGLSVSCCF